MPGGSHPVQVVVDLNPLRYQSSVNSFRMLLENVVPQVQFLVIAVKAPGGDLVKLQVRREDSYIVAFHGSDGWYSFQGEKGLPTSPG